MVRFALAVAVGASVLFGTLANAAPAQAASASPSMLELHSLDGATISHHLESNTKKPEPPSAPVNPRCPKDLVQRPLTRIKKYRYRGDSLDEFLAGRCVQLRTSELDAFEVQAKELNRPRDPCDHSVWEDTLTEFTGDFFLGISSYDNGPTKNYFNETIVRYCIQLLESRAKKEQEQNLLASIADLDALIIHDRNHTDTSNRTTVASVDTDAATTKKLEPRRRVFFKYEYRGSARDEYLAARCIQLREAKPKDFELQAEELQKPPRRHHPWDGVGGDYITDLSDQAGDFFQPREVRDYESTDSKNHTVYHPGYLEYLPDNLIVQHCIQLLEARDKVLDLKAQEAGKVQELDAEDAGVLQTVA